MADRRSLMKILAGAALLGAARRASAQKAKSFTVTYLALLPGEDRSFVPNFLRRLDQLGYVDGQNLRFVYRSAEGRPELLPGLASDLIRMKPDVLVTGFGTVAAKAGKAAGDSIPVVFMAVGDPVGAGVVASLARPGGNVTGLSDLAAGLQGIRLQLLREIVPAASLFAVVLNPGSAVRCPRLQGARSRSACREGRTPGLRGALARGDRAAARGQQGRRSRRPCDP
jgi:putative tryptophan/tyrosine transport system substrate-binding protein